MCRQIRQLHVAPPDTCCAGDILAMRDSGFSLCWRGGSKKTSQQRAGEHKNDTQCALKLFFPGGWTGNQCALFPIQGCRQKDARPCVCVLNGAWRKTYVACDPKNKGTQNASLTQNGCFIFPVNFCGTLKS